MSPEREGTVKFPRRRFLHLAAGAAALPAISRIARAQTYPTRPITMIVPFAAGTSVDTIGRIVAERMRRPLGQPVIVENVSGADGSIGVGRAARARPDGYTIGHVQYLLPYDVLNDSAPISPLVTGSYILFARKTIIAQKVTSSFFHACHALRRLEKVYVRISNLFLGILFENRDS